MKFSIIFAMLLSFPTWIASLFQSNKITSSPQNQKNMTTITSFYELEATTLDGETVTMEQYKGKKIIVLNVASKCGYTSQYADWELFYQANKDNVVILGFPCNQFGGQEPGTAEEIGAFCQKNYGVSFPMFDKVNVKGDGQSPIYKWLTDPVKNGWNDDVPSWNFCKYLIKEDGSLSHFFASKVTPESAEFLEAVK